jgi:small conductance mechanosensitive channel
VEEINLRTTVLRDITGNVHIVPNGSITTVTNMTREWARAVLDIGVAYESDIDHCLAVLRGVGTAMSEDPTWSSRLVGPFEYPGIERFEDSAVVLRMMVQTRPIEQWDVMRELRRRVKAAFDEAEIAIPYPHRMVITKAAVTAEGE